VEIVGEFRKRFGSKSFARPLSGSPLSPNAFFKTEHYARSMRTACQKESSYLGISDSFADAKPGGCAGRFESARIASSFRSSPQRPPLPPQPERRPTSANNYLISAQSRQPPPRHHFRSGHLCHNGRHYQEYITLANCRSMLKV